MALGSTQPLTEMSTGNLPGVKPPGSEADNTPPFSVEVKNGGTIPPLPLTNLWFLIKSRKLCFCVAKLFGTDSSVSSWRRKRTWSLERLGFLLRICVVTALNLGQKPDNSEYFISFLLYLEVSARMAKKWRHFLSWGFIAAVACRHGEDRETERYVTRLPPRPNQERQLILSRVRVTIWGLDWQLDLLNFFRFVTTNNYDPLTEWHTLKKDYCNHIT
jgi:hypothetical protein